MIIKINVRSQSIRSGGNLEMRALESAKIEEKLIFIDCF